MNVGTLRAHLGTLAKLLVAVLAAVTSCAVGIATAATAGAAGAPSISNGVAAFTVGDTAPTPNTFDVATLVQGGIAAVDPSSLALVTPAPAADATSTVSASSSHGLVTTTLATTGGTVNATGPFSLTFGYCAPGDATWTSTDPSCSTGTLTYDPSSGQNMGEELKILGLVTEDIYETVQVASVAPATAVQGTTFTIANAPVATSLPASEDGFTVNYADTFAAVVPVPAGLTYVPGSIKVEGGDANTAGQATGKYCTAAGTGCDAQVNTGNYKTTYPYIELELPSSIQVPGGQNVSMPTVVAQFTASGAVGSVEPVDLTEFKVDTNVSTAGNVNFDGYPTTGSSGTPPYAAPTPLSTTTIIAGTAPSITSASGATFTTGSPGSFTVTSTGNPTASLSEAGALPSGVTLHDNGNGTATLSGTPATSSGGSYPITLTAANGVSPNATQSFTLTVDSAPAITSASSTDFVTGSTGTFTVTSTGYPAASLSETGALPAGVGFVDNGNGTATLSGTPGAGTAGTYPVTITAANGVGTAANQSFTLDVEQAPAITSDTSTTFTTGSLGSFTVTSTGNPTASLSEAGALPSGVTLHDNGDGTATLAGTPGAGTGGIYPITLKASNGVSPDATQSFTLTVDSAPAITSGDQATFTEGVDSSFHVAASGVPAPALSESGALPSGLGFVDNGNGTATLSGTPTAASSGTYLVTITADNEVGTPATQDLTITVNINPAAPAFTSGASATFAEGSAGSFDVTTAGNPPPGLSGSGALPGGVTFVDNGDGTATLSGTPTADGVYTLDLTADNGVGTPTSQTFTLTVTSPPAITSAASTTDTVGTNSPFTVTATGTPTPSLTESGALPNGVSFVDNGNGTATLAGKPAAGTGGTYPVTVTAANGIGSDATQAFTLTVDQAAAVTSANTATFDAGSVGSFSVTTSGFPTPSLSETGTLPGGTTFVDNGDGTATLSGTPEAGGNFPVTVQATNGVGTPATQHLDVVVDAAPAITSAATESVVVGKNSTFSVTTTGYPAPAISESGALPGGMSFVDNGSGTAKLSGKPAAGSAGTYDLSLTADNGDGTPATQSFVLVVGSLPSFTSPASTMFDVGSDGSFTPTASGYPAPTISVWGTLPGGVTFSGGVLSGTVTSAGVFPIAFIATNSVGSTAQDFTLTVGGLKIATTSLPPATAGGAYSVQLTAVGGIQPLTWKHVGKLPKGLKLSKTGLLSGTPNAKKVAAGSYPITVKVTDKSPKPHQTVTTTLTLTVIS